MKKLLLTIISAVWVGCLSAAIPVEDFAKPLEYHNAVISPTGEYIAVQREAEDGKQLVAIISTKDLKLLSHIPATTGESPSNPRWVGDKKILVTFTESFFGREAEFTNGELMTMNIDGKQRRKIVEPQVFLAAEKVKRLNKLHGEAHLEHVLPDDKNHILIKYIEYSNARTGVKPKLLKIHTTRGNVKPVAESPSYNASFTYTPKGEPLYSIGIDKDNVKKSNHYVIHRNTEEGWQELEDIQIEGDAWRIEAATNDPSEVYITTSFDDRTDKVYRYNLETGEKKLVFVHPNVDPTSFDIDPISGELITARFDDGYPNIHLIQKDHLYSKWYPALFNVFDGNDVRITSATRDNKLLVIEVSGANEPGQFHIFNTETKKLRYLFNSASWVKPDLLAKVEPISFQARDDQTVHGYLTHPKKQGGKPSPLVVLVHGGPHTRDFWEYNSEVQFLASRGYAVLQLNYRGSSGYGHGFEKASDKNWGTTPMYDIIDGTKWAGSLDTINEDSICIMGGSFGGYSALMVPTMEPEMFKCAIGVVGVYDLTLMGKTGDTDDLRTTKNIWKQQLGVNQAQLQDFSPVNRVSLLKTPVMLAHGKKDWRVDFKHFEVMKKALEEKNHPHETLVFKKEGHGIANEQNRIEYYQAVEAFLAKYL